MTETWLGETKHLQFQSYELVSKHDRVQPSHNLQNHRGIQLYRRVGGPQITHLDDSLTSERNWHVLHTTIGPILFGLWYKPPNCEEDLANLESVT